mmetsp:Transcript_5343/g.12344  ORF Transcript_5343/g.12344 Transcript_5343/m.12344 type:complete len:323 (+) Transcript_5343:1525-2493(+)
MTELSCSSAVASPATMIAAHLAWTVSSLALNLRRSDASAAGNGLPPPPLPTRRTIRSAASAAFALNSLSTARSTCSSASSASSRVMPKGARVVSSASDTSERVLRSPGSAPLHSPPPPRCCGRHAERSSLAVGSTTGTMGTPAWCATVSSPTHHACEDISALRTTTSWREQRTASRIWSRSLRLSASKKTFTRVPSERKSLTSRTVLAEPPCRCERKMSYVTVRCRLSRHWCSAKATPAAMATLVRTVARMLSRSDIPLQRRAVSEMHREEPITARSTSRATVRPASRRLSARTRHGCSCSCTTRKAPRTKERRVIWISGWS